MNSDLPAICNNNAYAYAIIFHLQTTPNAEEKPAINEAKNKQNKLITISMSGKSSRNNSDSQAQPASIIMKTYSTLFSIC